MKIKVLRLEGFLPDAMHGMDEGFTAEVCGNVMYEVMETAGWGATKKGLQNLMRTSKNITSVSRNV